MDEKYIKYGTPIIKLIEEASEVQKECCKIERFGLDAEHPRKKKSNRILLEEEIQDLERSIQKVREWVKAVPEGSDIKVKE